MKHLLLASLSLGALLSSCAALAQTPPLPTLLERKGAEPRIQEVFDQGGFVLSFRLRRADLSPYEIFSIVRDALWNDFLPLQNVDGYLANSRGDEDPAKKGSQANIYLVAVPYRNGGIQELQDYVERHEGREILGQKARFLPITGLVMNFTVSARGKDGKDFVLTESRWRTFDSFAQAQTYFSRVEKAFRKKDLELLLQICSEQLAEEQVVRIRAAAPDAGTWYVDGSVILLTPKGGHHSSMYYFNVESAGLDAMR